MLTDSFGPRYFSLFLLNFAFTMNNTVGPSSETWRSTFIDIFAIDLCLDCKRYPASTSETCCRHSSDEQHRQYGIHLDTFHLHRFVRTALPTSTRDRYWLDGACWCLRNGLALHPCEGEQDARENGRPGFGNDSKRYQEAREDGGDGRH